MCVLTDWFTYVGASCENEIHRPNWLLHFSDVSLMVFHLLPLTCMQHFAVVDASEHKVLLVMYSTNLQNSSLYQSDKRGTSYSLSLDNIVVASPGLVGDPVFDVYKVQGLPATYLANRKLSHEGLNYTYITFNSGGRWTTVNPPILDSQRNLLQCHAVCLLCVTCV